MVGAEERRLALARAAGQDRLDIDDEAHVEHAVGLVEDHDPDRFEPQLAPANEVEHPAGGADHDLRPPVEGADLAVHGRPAVDGHRLHVPEPADAPDLVGHLLAQLAGRGQDQRLDRRVRRIHLLDDGNPEGRGLARTGLGLTDEVAPGAEGRDRAGLDLGRGHVAHLLKGPGDGDRDLDVAEPVAGGRGQDGGGQRGGIGWLSGVGSGEGLAAVRGGRGGRAAAGSATRRCGSGGQTGLRDGGEGDGADRSTAPASLTGPCAPV